MASVLPYDMFDIRRSASAARRYEKMESIYHRGQALAWDGHQVLDELWQRHGGSGLEPRQHAAAGRVLGAILWGELAAWRIAAQLADELEPIEAKMAATSQAHDEARHFYVMHDYLVRATGDFPRRMPKWSERLVASCLTADSMAKKIFGMQLQLETTALTLFHALRESKICPVLTDLLVYYEKDEARHVGLGTQILPTLMSQMSVPERVEFSLFSFRVATLSLASLKQSEGDFETLGVSPRRIAVLGKSKFTIVLNELWKLSPESKSTLGERAGLVFDALAEALWPDPNASRALGARARRVLEVFSTGYESIETVLDPTGDPGAAA
jgi:hypothetical protein